MKVLKWFIFGILWAVQCQSEEEKEKFEFYAEGYATWYGKGFHGRNTASGEIFDTTKYTAAHKTLPFGTFVRVTNLQNNLSVVVKINDRGPFHKNRIIDLSKGAAEHINMVYAGVAKVKLEILQQQKAHESKTAQ